MSYTMMLARIESKKRKNRKREYNASYGADKAVECSQQTTLGETKGKK